MLGDARDDPPFEHFPKRGDADQRSDLADLQTIDQAIRVQLVEVDDPRPARQGQQQAAGELERVVQRQHTEHAIATPERKERCQRRDQRGQILVGELNAFGLASGAAGVDEHRHIVGFGHDAQTDRATFGHGKQVAKGQMAR